jgi:restriction system protein
MKFPPLFLVDLVGSFWAWVISIGITFWVVVLAVALVSPIVRWIIEKILKAVGYVIISPILIAEKVWKKDQKDDYKSKVGREFEEKVGALYASQGYNVAYRGIENGKLDGGIDLIAVKENEIILIQCKYWKKRKIDHTVVRVFFGDCFVYALQNKLPFEIVTCVMAIPTKQSLDYSAEVRFKENYPKMRYKAIEQNYKKDSK